MCLKKHANYSALHLLQVFITSLHHQKLTTKLIKNNPQKGQIYPPFLQSVASNEIDVGNNFDHRSRFHLDSLNAAILSPPLYIYLMSAYSIQLISDVSKVRTRIDHLNYYLRFHNSHEDTAKLRGPED